MKYDDAADDGRMIDQGNASEQGDVESLLRDVIWREGNIVVLKGRKDNEWRFDVGVVVTEADDIHMKDDSTYATGDIAWIIEAAVADATINTWIVRAAMEGVTITATTDDLARELDALLEHLRTEPFTVGGTKYTVTNPQILRALPPGTIPGPAKPRTGALPDDLGAPLVFDESGLAALPMYHPVFALMNAIHDAPRLDSATGKPRNWSDLNGSRPPTHITRGRRGEIRVSVRGDDGAPAPRIESLPALWEKVSDLDDIPSDVLLYGLAQWATINANEPFWIHAPAVLDARGIQRKKPSEKQREQGELPAWQHGHRQEDLIEVGRAIAQLESFWLETVNLEVIPARKRGGKATFINVESRAMAILDRVRQSTLDGESVFLAAKVMFGSWAKEYEAIGLRQIGAIAQQALKYDPYHQDLEKRLAKYLAFHFHWNGRAGGLITRRVTTLLEGAGREPDTRNPHRTIKRLHDALQRIEADGVIGGWGYGPVDREHPLHDAPSLPSKKWLPTWLELRVWLAPSQALVDRLPQHYRIAPTALPIRH